MRIGFESDQHFHEILDLINSHEVALLSLHARTVKGGYKSEVQYEYIEEAAKIANCPVLANGNITSYLSSEKVLRNPMPRRDDWPILYSKPMDFQTNRRATYGKTYFCTNFQRRSDLY